MRFGHMNHLFHHELAPPSTFRSSSFHVRLHCYIDLKVVDFQPKFAGK